ncbi:alpha/beta hydrolase [Geodermatophilus sp. SYSU D00691]
MSAPSLAAVAGYDLPLLRGAVGTLDVVAGRLPAWRARVEAVGRALGTAECWSGPAAREAAQAVVGLSRAATAVSAALADSLDSFAVLLAAAETAGPDAAAALAVAAAEGVVLTDDGHASGPAEAADRVGALASRALAAATAVGTAAEAADRALLPVGVVDAFPPVDFDGLVSGLPAGPVLPPVPPDAGAARAARWWAALSAAEQEAAIAASPGLVGALDGVPAWARDRANRRVLAAALESPVPDGTATAVAAEVRRQEAAGRPVQLWSLDLAQGMAGLAVGDLDTADAVAVLVPGILTTPEDDLSRVVGDAVDVVAAARAAAPGLAVAGLVWIGYRTPHDPLSILTRGDARRGGAALDDALDGLAAARGALAAPAARTTVLAHSYGTVVVDEAAGEEGRLAADALVLLGSPGLGRAAGELEAAEVYAAASRLDPVSWSGWFGDSPTGAGFGATTLPADPGTLHWEYYDRDRPTLAAVAEVVAATPGEA